MLRLTSFSLAPLARRRLFAGLILCCSSSFNLLSQSVAAGQNVGDWKLIGIPPGLLQLVTIEPFTSDSMRFTFQNLSGKAIISLLIAAPSGDMTGPDAFTIGAGATEPGETVSVIFGQSNFQIKSATLHSLRIAAIVYADGSHLGSKKTLDLVEDEMLGAALETKRDANILAATPDPSMAGLSTAASNIGSRRPSKDEEAIASVRGLTLTSVPQAYIDAHVGRRSGHLVAGINRARQSLLNDIDNNISLASLPITRSKKRNDLVQRAQMQSRSDMAKKYRALSETQAQIIKAFMGASDAK